MARYSLISNYLVLKPPEKCLLSYRLILIAPKEEVNACRVCISNQIKKEGRVGCEEASGVDILKGVSLHKLCKYDIV